MRLLQPFLRSTRRTASSLSQPRALLLAPGQQSLRNEYYALRHGWSKANEAGIIVSRIDSGARLEYAPRFLEAIRDYRAVVEIMRSVEDDERDNLLSDPAVLGAGFDAIATAVDATAASIQALGGELQRNGLLDEEAEEECAEEGEESGIQLYVRPLT